MAQDEKSLRAELAEIDERLLKLMGTHLDVSVMERIYDVMSVAGAASDGAKASFVLGQIYEALLPMRDRARLTARRSRIVAQLQKGELEG